MSRLHAEALRCALPALIAAGGLLLSAPVASAAPPKPPSAEPIAGLAAGYVDGFKEFHSGDQEGHDLRGLTLLPFWQTSLGAPLAVGGAWGGRFAFRAEGTLILAFEPRAGIGGGLGLFFRYEFDRFDRGDSGVLPYVQVGAGVLGIDFDISDQVDGFAFQPQAAAGLRQRVGRRLSVDYGIRYHHISNAFTRSPNGGIDSVQLVIGLAWRCD